MKALHYSKLIPFLLFPTTSQAAMVVADFNDLNVAALSSTISGSGQAGGSGFGATTTWDGTGTINVVAGDLSAPAGTNYALTQSGDARSIQGYYTTLRQAYRTTASTLAATGGDIWFSMLINQVNSESRAGISFNQSSSTSSNRSLFIVLGTEVRLGINTIGASDPMNNPSIVLGTTNLFLGKLSIDPSGDENFSLWINPDVSGGISGLGTASATITEDVASFDSGITRVGMLTYATGNDNQGGIIDALHISDAADGNQAFADVTGVLVPEPSTALLSSMALAGMLLRRKRN